MGEGEREGIWLPSLLVHLNLPPCFQSAYLKSLSIKWTMPLVILSEPLVVTALDARPLPGFRKSSWIFPIRFRVNDCHQETIKFYLVDSSDVPLVLGHPLLLAVFQAFMKYVLRYILHTHCICVHWNFSSLVQSMWKYLYLFICKASEMWRVTCFTSLFSRLHSDPGAPSDGPQENESSSGPNSFSEAGPSVLGVCQLLLLFYQELSCTGGTPDSPR